MSSTERAHAWGATLLARHGIVVRETAAVEALGGGFGNVYRVLRSMEEAGKVRRGYFIEGLGGAQFAFPGTVDRLRRVRDDASVGEVAALAAADPANAYGWLLPWPALRSESGQGARRASGAVVVLVDGEPVLFLDRSGRRLRTFEDTTPGQIGSALSALRGVARRRPRRALVIEKIDEQPALASELKPLLLDAGFEVSYRFLRLNAEG
jgi:ATP-dependent Lhr-like helicase